MKRILSITGILALAILFTSAISIREIPQDPPRGKKGKKHITMVKVDEKGKKMKIDTLMNIDEVLIWNGDTIDNGKAVKWISEEDFDLDMDMDMDFNFDIEEDGEGMIFITKSGKSGVPAVYEFKTAEGDSSKEYRIKVIADGDDMMKWSSKANSHMFFDAPRAAHAPKVIRIEKQRGNVIDLSDPGIISFEKKELKDGKEKITIVREKPSEEDIEIHEEIIMHGAGSHPMIIHEGHGAKSKQIKVIADDEGKVEIFEDGEIWSVEEGDENVKVIEKDGKKIIIKKTKEGKEMKVDVEVEEEIEKQK